MGSILIVILVVAAIAVFTSIASKSQHEKGQAMLVKYIAKDKLMTLVKKTVVQYCHIKMILLNWLK